MSYTQYEMRIGMTKLTNWKECVEALLAGKTLESHCETQIFLMEDGRLSGDYHFNFNMMWSIVEPTITITESEMRDALVRHLTHFENNDVRGNMGFKK